MTTATRNKVSVLRERIEDARGNLEGTMRDVTPEQACWMPGGKAMPITAQYAHVVATQDMALHGLIKGTSPLLASTWAGKSGFKEPPPMGPGSSLDEWAHKEQIDLKALREYAQAVYEACDDHFASLSDEELRRPIDLSALGFGQPPLEFVLANGWINNVLMHCGEISCLKGLQGAKGYPF